MNSMPTPPMPMHIEDGTCWCESDIRREQELDAAVPGRCRIPGSEDTPQAGRILCVLLAGHVWPCCGCLDAPGWPCHFCGQHYIGQMCPRCWTSVSDIAHADLKALFAGSDLNVTTEGKVTL